MHIVLDITQTVLKNVCICLSVYLYFIFYLFLIYYILLNLYIFKVYYFYFNIYKKNKKILQFLY